MLKNLFVSSLIGLMIISSVSCDQNVKAKSGKEGVSVTIVGDFSESSIASFKKENFEALINKIIKGLEIRSGLDKVNIVLVNHKGVKKIISLSGAYNAGELKTLISESTIPDKKGTGTPLGEGMIQGIIIAIADNDKAKRVIVFLSDGADEKGSFNKNLQNINDSVLNKFLIKAKKEKIDLVAFIGIDDRFENKLNKVKNGLPSDKFFLSTLAREKVADFSYGYKEVLKKVNRLEDWF